MDTNEQTADHPAFERKIKVAEGWKTYNQLFEEFTELPDYGGKQTFEDYLRVRKMMPLHVENKEYRETWMDKIKSYGIMFVLLGVLFSSIFLWIKLIYFLISKIV